MLPTDQTPDVHLMNFVAAQTRRIAISPDESLGVGRDQLAMVVDQATIRVKEQQAVVKRSMARSVLNTFVYPMTIPILNLAAAFASAAVSGPGTTTLLALSSAKVSFTGPWFQRAAS